MRITTAISSALLGAVAATALAVAPITSSPANAAAAPAAEHPAGLQFSDGRLIRMKGTQPVFYMLNGQKRGIPDPTTFNLLHLDWDAVSEYSFEIVTSIPTGPVIPVLSSGSLMMGDAAETIFYLDGTAKRAVPDPITFEQLHFDWGAVKTLPQVLANRVSTGTALPVVHEGSWITNGQYANFYKMVGGKKRFWPDGFVTPREDWPSAALLPHAVINGIPTGPWPDPPGRWH